MLNSIKMCIGQVAGSNGGEKMKGLIGGIELGKITNKCEKI